MNNGFAFAAKNTMCTETSHNYTFFAIKNDRKAFVELAHGSFSREMFGSPGVVEIPRVWCSLAVEMRVTALNGSQCVQCGS